MTDDFKSFGLEKGTEQVHSILEVFYILVAEIEYTELEISQEDYKIWCEDVELDVLAELERGELNMTGTEVRWVVLDALHRHMKEAAFFDEVLQEDVESHVLITTLSVNGFCPAFEDEIRAACRDVIRKWMVNTGAGVLLPG